jgi:hypothetical protein
MRKKGNYSIGAARKGKTEIESYSKKGNFNSAGHKRQGDHKYEDYPDKPGYDSAYNGGTDPKAQGNIPE